MTYRLCPAIGLCLTIAGCAGPLDGDWDRPYFTGLQYQGDQIDQQKKTETGELAVRPPSALESLDRLEIDDAIRLAIANSPLLQSAGYRIDAASGRVMQAGLYPNPSLVFDAEALGSEAGSGGETIYRLEQEIALGGKLRRARDVAKADKQAWQTRFVAVEFAVASRVARAYFGAVAAEGRLARRQELADLADQLLAAATAQVEAGSATMPDQLRAEVVAEQAKLEFETAKFKAKATRRVLAARMGLADSIGLPLSTPVDQLPTFPAYDELLSTVLKSNSRVSLAQIAIERARRIHKLAKAQANPDLVVSVGPRYSDIENETTLDIGLGLEIPLFDRNQGEIQAAFSERLSAAADLRKVQLELLAEVSLAWASYQIALDATTRYRDRLLPKADQTLKLTRQAYQRGKADYLRLLDAQQVVVESRIAYIDSLQSLHEAAATLRELAQSDAPWRNTHSAVQSSEEIAS